MRPDMAKVIVERPRYGSRQRGKPKGYRRKLRLDREDGESACEGMGKRWLGNRKGLNEHLGPLRRYLDSNVGRPWDLVFSEICKHIDRDSAVQDHVRDHVDDYVVRLVIEINGVLCHGEPDHWYGQPLSNGYRRKWYVCPRSGLLKRVKPPKKQAMPKRSECPVVKLGPTEICKVIDGAWHLVTIKPIPAFLRLCRERDVVLDRSVAYLDVNDAIREYGAKVFAVAKRVVSRRELRQMPVVL